MAQPTPEERARMAEVPRGTYALMAVVGLLLFAGWIFFYFGRFLPAGPVR